MSPFNLFQSFRSKLIALVLLTSLVTAGFVGGALVWRNHLKLQDMAYSHMRAEADVVALQSSDPLWHGDVEAAQRKLSALAAWPEIGAVCLYDLHGNIFAYYLRDSDERLELQPGFGKREHADWLVIENKPIEYEGTVVGRLEMAYDIAPITARLHRSVVMGVVLGLLAAGASVLVSLRLQRGLARPITSLTETAGKVTDTQDYSHRARKYGDDELGMLTSVFNGMLEDIEQANAERAALLESERAARTEAEQATRIKDEFVAMLSHELRTPLAAILGWAQLLRRGAVPGDQTDEALETIERNTRLQMRMVEDLLDMSRILSGKLRMDVQPVSLREIVQAAANTVELAATAKHIDLVRRIDPNVDPVLGDSGRLQQVVWNLLNNAVKFTPEGGRVTLALSQRDGHAVIDVADNGPGIEPAFLTHVFDRFRQADDAAKQRHEGLGLGLAIVKQIVELHGGVVRAASEGLGRGATFTVELPVASSSRTSNTALAEKSFTRE